MIRCVNIDWLECYCIEDSIGYPHNADYFRQKGWEVREREYGTPMYEEMFTLIDHYNEPFIEVRRKPKSMNTIKQGLFDPYSCHLRLVNRACYSNTAASDMANFLAQNGFTFRRISRIDICLDFERFDFGDEPQKFLQRFMAGRYSKINQANISAHGLDQWDGRAWNSISWGAKKSMVTTRFYNKTMELSQAHDKPYIRQAWQLCGLVDDWQTLEKKDRHGKTYKPAIWRVEFAIKSGTNKWFVVEDYQGDRKRLISLPNTLDVYETRQKVFQVWLSVAQRYFHFKHVEYKNEKRALVKYALQAVTPDKYHPLVRADTGASRELQRKDRCKDKELFRVSQLDTFYSFEKRLSSAPRNLQLERLLQRLYEYRERQYDQRVREACEILIQKLETEVRTIQIALPFNTDEIKILQHVVQLRMKDKAITIQEARKEAELLFKIEREIWQNPY